MGQMVADILLTTLTGCMVTFIASIFTMHSRFIRLEESVRYIRKDIARLERTVTRRIPRIHVSNDWENEEKDSDDKKW